MLETVTGRRSRRLTTPARPPRRKGRGKSESSSARLVTNYDGTLS
jgi:hypothetical protein